MELFHVYVPEDRLHALIAGEKLAERVEGAALFADLSGFTALTEMLAKELGPKRGAEELLVFLDRIYDPLVYQVGQYRGSVIGFSGDAITCWFDNDNGCRAAACALSMQKEMQNFASLKTSFGSSISIGVKVAVTTGTARRFLVGDPEIQVIEALAGSPIEMLAIAEHLAVRGEIILDHAAAQSLNDAVEVAEWRRDENSDQPYAVLKGLTCEVKPAPWSDVEPAQLNREQLRPWLLPPVYERLTSGGGEFLAELRPAVALFMRFGSIDYINDEQAGEKLDKFIRHVQQIINCYRGSLIQVTIGEKGSYFFAAFGAPFAHEDDTRRAVSAALEMRYLSQEEGIGEFIQIGISEGRMRTGSYGSKTRRTYGVLGPQTNLAARLMQHAAPGQILVSPDVHKATSWIFEWDELMPIKMKGIAEPLPVFSLGHERARRAINLQEPRYSLPMIGREAEIALIGTKLDLVEQGSGQVVVITGDAGMGKSRLMAEAIRVSGDRNLEAFGGECHSYGTDTSYHLWHNIWRAFFNLDPGASLEESTRALHNRLMDVDQILVQRLPLLAPVLNLPLDENDLTRFLDPKLRKNLLEGLLATCVRARAHQTPILFILENCHWIDPLSEELLHKIASSIANLPVFVLMARRPLANHESVDNLLGSLPYTTVISLSEFTPEESEKLIRLKLDQTTQLETSTSSKLVQEISSRAQGNPFYIEELINYLRDARVNPHEIDNLDNMDLPRNLQSLILTRIDQRTESQKITLKLASVIGRMFIAAWLWGAYPDLGDVTTVKRDLEILDRLELTPLERAEPELTYLFKHILTREVAYDSLPYATKALLHNQIAQYIENTLSDFIDRYVDLLAYHYSQSNNDPKKREYLLKAGIAAQANYANQAAINYYQTLLPLLNQAEQIDVILKLGQVLERVGKWDEVKALYQQGLDLGIEINDIRRQASSQIAMGELLRKRGAYKDAAMWLESAREGFEAVADLAGVGQVLHCAGTLAAQQGDYATARQSYESSLSIRRKIADQINIASLLSNLGILSRYERDDTRARQLYLESLAIRREVGDRWGIAVSLNNLGIHAMDQNQLEEARTYLEEAVGLQREIGDQYYLANNLNNLGNVARAQGDFAYASQLYRESLTRNRDLGDGWQIAYVLTDMGGLAAMAGDARRSVYLISAASALRVRTKAVLAPHEQARLEKFLQTARQTMDQDQWDSAWEHGYKMTLEESISLALGEETAGSAQING